MRAFFAVPIGRQINSCLMARDFGSAGRALRWVPSHQMHLTLRFLGEIAGGEVSCMRNRLHEAAASFPPFSLEWDRTGVFPHKRNPRVFWVGLRNESADIVKEIARKLGEPEVRPHVTVARVKERAAPDLVRKWCEYTVDWPPIWVRELVFMKSTLSAQGAVHETLSRAVLGRGG